jgi:hypothetical protein
MKKIRTVFLKLFGLFKKIFRRRPKFFSIFKRHRSLLIFPIIIFLLSIYFLSVIFLISPANAKLLSLQKNIEAAGPCHEGCLLARKQLRDELATYFKQDKKFQKNVENLFLADSANKNSTSSLNFKKELLEIMFEANGAGNPPDFIADYFLSAEAQPELKAEIIRLFLAPVANSELIDYYFAVLNSEESVAIKTEVVKALSSLANKGAYFKVEEIYQLEDLVLNSNAPLNSKADFIFLLSDFYDFFPVETQRSLTTIFQNSSQNVVKSFVAAALNNFGFSEFVAPEVTETEWVEYFNN